MRVLLLALLLGASLNAQSLTFSIDPNDGKSPLQPFPSAYSFSGTPIGQMTSVLLRVTNNSSAPVTINAIYVGPAAGSSAADNNFSITGFQVGATLAVNGGWKDFFLNFTPTAAGPFTGYLQVSVAGKTPAAVSTLAGTGLPNSVSLTCQDNILALCDGKTPIPPNTALLFGPTAGLAPTTSHPISFTLTNNTTAGIPRPVLATQQFAIAPFTSPDLAATPATLNPGATATFTLVFTAQATAFGPSSPETAILTVGSATYTLQGYELVVSQPQVACVYTTGKPCQGAASTITLGPDLNTIAAIFRVTNPNPQGTTFADIKLSAPPALSDTTDFTMSPATLALTNSTSAGTAITAGQPVTIQPGYTLTFQITFRGATAASGTLTIGNGITYTLNGQPAPAVGSSGSDLPGITLICGTAPCSSSTFASQQQVQATLQVTSATTAGANLAISFTPAVSGVTDPAVTFITPFTQTNLNFSFTPASLSGMLSNGQPQFTFQTGTTAGTINFTLVDSATQQSMKLPAITIQPSKVQITSTTAVRQSPNLVVTITGYDNTYSVGPLSFTFNDTSGKLLTPAPIAVNATSAFQQYFFGATNQSGGAFSVQITFPVSGDVNQVGSVTSSLTNSAGQASVTSTFQ